MQKQAEQCRENRGDRVWHKSPPLVERGKPCQEVKEVLKELARRLSVEECFLQKEELCKVLKGESA
jgi:hypothetical protein